MPDNVIESAHSSESASKAEPEWFKEPLFPEAARARMPLEMTAAERLLDDSRITEKPASLAPVVPANQEERETLRSIQKDLIEQLSETDFGNPESAKKIAAIKQEMSGIDSFSGKEISKESPIMGDATRAAFQEYLDRVNEQFHEAYRRLSHAQAEFPANGPFKLAKRGNDLQTPESLLRELESENAIVLKLKADPGRIPSIQELAKRQTFINETNKILTEINSRRMRVSAEELCKMHGFDWKPENEAECRTALKLIKKINHFTNVVATLDNMAAKATDASYIKDWFIHENRQRLLERLNKLPEFVTMQKTDGELLLKIKLDLPKDLRLDSEDWIEKLRQIDEWLKENGTPVEQLRKELERRNHNQIAAYLNKEVIDGWVTDDAEDAARHPDTKNQIQELGADGKIQDKNKNHEFVDMSGEKPDGDSWKHFNRLYLRASVLKQTDASGNLQYKLVTERSYYEIPLWGYHDCVGTEVAKVRVEDKEWRSGEEWVLIYSSSGDRVPVRLKDVETFVKSQEAVHRTEQAIETAFDALLLVEGGLAAWEARSLVAAANGSSKEVLQMFRSGAAALRPSEALSLARTPEYFIQLARYSQAKQFVQALEKNPAMLKTISSALRDNGYAELGSGLLHMVLGGSGFAFNPPAAAELPLVPALRTIRHGYFLGAISYGVIVSPLARLGGFFQETQRERLLSMIIDAHNAALWTQAGKELTHQGMFYTQIPLLGILSKETWKSYHSQKASGERDLLNLIWRLEPAEFEKIKKEQAGTVLELGISTLEKMQHTCKLTGQRAKKLERIISECRIVLAPDPMSGASEVDATKLEEIQLRKQKLINELLAPEFLMSAEQLKAFEIERASLDPDAAERPALDSEALHILDSKGKNGEFDKEARKIAGLTLLLLLRNEKGEIETYNESHGTCKFEASPTLYQRTLKPEHWSVRVLDLPQSELQYLEKSLKEYLNNPILHVLAPVDAALDFKTIAPAETRPGLTQKIEFQQIIDLLAEDLSLKDVRTDDDFLRIMQTGDVLCRLGTNSHRFALALEQIINRPEASQKIRTEAIHRLASLAEILRAQELKMRPSEFTDYQGKHPGATADDLFDFLVKSGSNSNLSKQDRLLALYFAYVGECSVGSATEADMQLAEQLSSGMHEGMSDKIVTRLRSAAFSTDTNPFMLESKLAAIRILQAHPWIGGGDSKTAREDLGIELLDCAEQARRIAAENIGVDAERFWTASRVAESAFAELSGRCNIDGINKQNLAILDESNRESVRQRAELFRKNLVDELQSDDQAIASTAFKFLPLLPAIFAETRSLNESESLTYQRERCKQVLKRAIIERPDESGAREASRVLHSNSSARAIVLKILGEMECKGLQKPAKSYSRIEFEDDAKVRLAALELLKNECTAMEFTRHCDLLAKTETDLAVRTYLDKFSFSSMDKDVEAIVERPPHTEPFCNHTDKLIEQAVSNYGLEIFDPEKRLHIFEKIAIDYGVLGQRWLAIALTATSENAYRDDGTPYTIHFNREAVFDYNERQRQREHWLKGLANLDKLCMTSRVVSDMSSEQEIDRQNSRKLLLMLACSKNEDLRNDWDRNPDSEVYSTRAYRLFTIGAKEIEELRSKAAMGLVEAALVSRNSKEVLPDLEMKKLQEQLWTVLLDAPGIYSAKMQVVDALLASAESTDNNASTKRQLQLAEVFASALDETLRLPPQEDMQLFQLKLIRAMSCCNNDPLRLEKSLRAVIEKPQINPQVKIRATAVLAEIKEREKPLGQNKDLNTSDAVEAGDNLKQLGALQIPGMEENGLRSSDWESLRLQLYSAAKTRFEHAANRDPQMLNCNLELACQSFDKHIESCILQGKFNKFPADIQAALAESLKLKESIYGESNPEIVAHHELAAKTYALIKEQLQEYIQKLVDPVLRFRAQNQINYFANAELLSKTARLNCYERLSPKDSEKLVRMRIDCLQTHIEVSQTFMDLAGLYPSAFPGKLPFAIKQEQERFINLAELELKKTGVHLNKLSRSALAGDRFSKEQEQCNNKVEKLKDEIALMRAFVYANFKRARAA